MAEHLPRNTVCHIGNCEVKIARKLGEGGSKAVYAADLSFPGDAQGPSRQAIAVSLEENPQFCREVPILENARLKGASIMDGPYPLVDDKGKAYRVAIGEALPGQNVDSFIMANGPQSPAATAGIMAQVARSLHSAHRDGFVHMDVKSGNVIRSPEGACTLIDWEMVHRQGEIIDRIAGTPDYMAPEMACIYEKPVNTKMDVYSAGLMMEELANGRIRDRCDPRLNFSNPTDAYRGFKEISENREQSTTRDPLLSLTMQRATEYDHLMRGTALDMMTDLAAFPEARKHYDEEDRADIVNNLMERTKDLYRRQPVLDAAAARGMLEDLPKNHAKRANLEAIEKLAPPPKTLGGEVAKQAQSRSNQQTTTYELDEPGMGLRR